MLLYMDTFPSFSVRIVLLMPLGHPFLPKNYDTSSTNSKSFATKLFPADYTCYQRNGVWRVLYMPGFAHRNSNPLTPNLTDWTRALKKETEVLGVPV